MKLISNFTLDELIQTAERKGINNNPHQNK